MDQSTDPIVVLGDSIAGEMARVLQEKGHTVVNLTKNGKGFEFFKQTNLADILGLSGKKIEDVQWQLSAEDLERCEKAKIVIINLGANDGGEMKKQAELFMGDIKQLLRRKCPDAEFAFFRPGLAKGHEHLTLKTAHYLVDQYPEDRVFVLDNFQGRFAVTDPDTSGTRSKRQRGSDTCKSLKLHYEHRDGGLKYLSETMESIISMMCPTAVSGSPSDNTSIVPSSNTSDAGDAAEGSGSD